MSLCTHTANEEGLEDESVLTDLSFIDARRRLAAP